MECWEKEKLKEETVPKASPLPVWVSNLSPGASHPELPLRGALVCFPFPSDSSEVSGISALTLGSLPRRFGTE